jgi:purine-binding chemotaxis protein CheW
MEPNQGQDAKREMISFRTGAQEFCVDIQSVREIRGWTPATPMPHAPEFVRGVINLRGTVMPVLDLGARFGFGVTEPSERHVIIVAQIAGQQVGLLVDAVCETLNVASGEIQPAPDIAGDECSQLFKGFLPMGDRMITLVDLACVVPEPAEQ